MTVDTIPISDIAQRTLVELAARTGQSPTAILDAAVEEYRRKMFFEAMNAGYAALRADPQAWADERAERRAWDATNADRLPQEPTAGKPR
jgi:predicted transcriptional regulator